MHDIICTSGSPIKLLQDTRTTIEEMDATLAGGVHNGTSLLRFSIRHSTAKVPSHPQTLEPTGHVDSKDWTNNHCLPNGILSRGTVDMRPFELQPDLSQYTYYLLHRRLPGMM
jgi:hypothetical protein